jgi:predicted transcriptional regulator
MTSNDDDDALKARVLQQISDAVDEATQKRIAARRHLQHEEATPQVTDDELLDEMTLRAARMLPADAYLRMLAEADNAARAAKHRLSVLTKVGIERTDITRGQMANALGVNRRTVYKRRDQI